MSKTFVVVALLAALGIGGYVYVSAQKAAEAEAVAAAKAAAQAAADEKAAVEAAKKEAAAKEAAETLKKAQDAAADVLKEAAPSLAETLLSGDDIDVDKVVALIDQSDINPLKKTALTAAVKKAADNPELRKAVLEQVRQALGL
jgi:hypothetical protein